MVGDDRRIVSATDLNYSGPYNALTIPTREDVLDLNFWAIVATCRHVISGTAGVRTLSQFAGGWAEDLVKDRKLHKSDQARGRMAVAAKLAWKKRKGGVTMPDMPGLPNVDIQQKLDDALAGSEEAQKYIDKVWYVPDGAPVPPGVTHNLVLTSARDENMDLHLGIVANDKTAALADVLLALMNRPPAQPERGQDHGRR